MPAATKPPLVEQRARERVEPSVDELLDVLDQGPTHGDRRRASRERRESRRAPFVAAVRSAPIVDEGRGAELSLSMDLSTTGMRLRRCAHAAALMRLEFELPDGGAPIVANGRLEFERGDGSFVAAGIRFVELGADDAERIARYVASA